MPSRILPDGVVKTLKIDLYNLVHNSRLPNDYERNVELCRVFLKVFVKTLGNYANFIVPCEHDKREEASVKKDDEFKFLVNIYLIE